MGDTYPPTLGPTDVPPTSAPTDVTPTGMLPICTGDGLIAATSAPGLGSPLPHLRRDCQTEGSPLRQRVCATAPSSRAVLFAARLALPVQVQMWQGRAQSRWLGLAGDVGSITIGSWLWSCSANCNGSMCLLGPGTSELPCLRALVGAKVRFDRSLRIRGQ
jgi:hypothetical protein